MPVDILVVPGTSRDEERQLGCRENIAVVLDLGFPGLPGKLGDPGIGGLLGRGPRGSRKPMAGRSRGGPGEGIGSGRSAQDGFLELADGS